MLIGNSGIYVETNRNARALVLLSQHVMALFEIEPGIRIGAIQKIQSRQAPDVDA